MPTITNFLQNIFPKPELIKPGIYHFQAPPDDPHNYRFHLRVEPDGSGILIINAATILHLNQTATELGYYLVKNETEEKVVKNLTTRYPINRKQALKDFQSFKDRIEAMITTPDLDPVTHLDFDRQNPYSGQISVPYRLDCAITYRLPPDNNPEFAPTKNITRELTTQEWITIIDRAWQFGIPHIVITGGEPTLRDDLVLLIEAAEKNGQVTGLITDGRRLINLEYLNNLLTTGLDHIMVVWDFVHTDQWQALENTTREDLYTSVHITLSSSTIPAINETIKRLADTGINGLSLTASKPEYNPHLQAASELATNLQIPLTWNLPVPYSSQNPVTLEVPNQNQEEGAGRAWLYVEPDGDVLPEQGNPKLLGNLLTNSFEEIYSPSS
jgi:organic radical activating enzyme